MANLVPGLELKPGDAGKSGKCNRNYFLLPEQMEITTAMPIKKLIVVGSVRGLDEDKSTLFVL